MSDMSLFTDRECPECLELIDIHDYREHMHEEHSITIPDTIYPPDSA